METDSLSSRALAGLLSFAATRLPESVTAGRIAAASLSFSQPAADPWQDFVVDHWAQRRGLEMDRLSAKRCENGHVFSPLLS